MLINQLREITGIQDPQTLYKALNVSPEIVVGRTKRYNLSLSLNNRDNLITVLQVSKHL